MIKDTLHKEKIFQLLISHKQELLDYGVKEIGLFLEELLDSKVDLITKQSQSPYIGSHILKTVEYVPLAS